MIVIGGISDTMPMLYDVTVTKETRGKRIGTACVTCAIDYIFSSSKDKIRMEAYTRTDNYPMRKVFFNCNFQKESYLRHSWEKADGTVSDSFCYAIIRSDWEMGIRTAINLEDMPF